MQSKSVSGSGIFLTVLLAALMMFPGFSHADSFGSGGGPYSSYAESSRPQLGVLSTAFELDGYHYCWPPPRPRPWAP